jgi:preprotein translocase subunit SecG
LQHFLFSAILKPMEFLATVLPWVQIILSIILTATILLQQTGAGVGGALGGGDDSIRYTRRGMEKALFYTSIVVAILFALSAFAMLLLRA